MTVAILAIDQGTTGTTCVLYGSDGAVMAKSYREISQIYPREGWVEHDPQDIWLSVHDGVRELLDACDTKVKGIGITNQRETLIVWDCETGRPVANAIVWQCRRTARLCERYREYEPLIRSKTGLPLDAYFSATKIRWILEHVVEGDTRRLLCGTVDSWLVWKLTGGGVHATDMTNASRTLLFDIIDRQWDDELLRIFDIPRHMLPEVKASIDDYGTVTSIDELRGVRIAAVAGDQQAALFGQCCFEPGSVKNTYGTGCFMVMNTGDEYVCSSNGLVTTLAVNPDGSPCFALEGSVFIGGAVIQWLRDELRIISSAEESEQIALRAGSSAGVYLVPAFAGLGAPHWNMEARGTIVGLTRGSGRDHIVRAALESIAYQSCDVFNAMSADTGLVPGELVVDGGAAANGFLMQFQADMLGVAVSRPDNIESTSLGAAYLAGTGLSFWGGPGELEALNGGRKKFSPGHDAADRRTLLMDGWRRALRQTMAG
jgi:glycerol kinase